MALVNDDKTLENIEIYLRLNSTPSAILKLDAMILREGEPQNKTMDVEAFVEQLLMGDGHERKD